MIQIDTEDGKHYDMTEKEFMKVIKAWANEKGMETIKVTKLASK